MKVVTAKFNSRCRETKKLILAGEIILFNPVSKYTWCVDSRKYVEFIKKQALPKTKVSTHNA